MKPQGGCEVGEAPCAQAQEKVPGAAGQAGAESGGAETLGVPNRYPCSGQGVSGARTLQGKDRRSGLGRGEPAIRGVPLSSATSHTESQSGCPARALGCQGAPAQSHPPKPASVSQGVSEKCPLSPRAALSGGMGPAAGGSTIPFWR